MSGNAIERAMTAAARTDIRITVKIFFVLAEGILTFKRTLSFSGEDAFSVITRRSLAAGLSSSSKVRDFSGRGSMVLVSSGVTEGLLSPCGHSSARSASSTTEAEISFFASTGSLLRLDSRAFSSRYQFVYASRRVSEENMKLSRTMQ